MRDWWLQRSRREQILLQVMALIALPIIAYFLLIKPLLEWEERARADYLVALDRQGRVAAMVGGPDGAADGYDGSLALLVGNSAEEIGLQLDSNVEEGPDRLRIAVEEASGSAALAWIDRLESSGLSVEALQITPTGSGNVSIEATLSRGGR